MCMGGSAGVLPTEAGVPLVRALPAEAGVPVAGGTPDLSGRGGDVPGGLPTEVGVPVAGGTPDLSGRGGDVPGGLPTEVGVPVAGGTPDLSGRAGSPASAGSPSASARMIAPNNMEAAGRIFMMEGFLTTSGDFSSGEENISWRNIHEADSPVGRSAPSERRIHPAEGGSPTSVGNERNADFSRQAWHNPGLPDKSGVPLRRLPDKSGVPLRRRPDESGVPILAPSHLGRSVKMRPSLPPGTGWTKPGGSRTFPPPPVCVRFSAADSDACRYFTSPRSLRRISSASSKTPCSP